MGVTAGIFLTSILLKEMHYLISSVYKISMAQTEFVNKNVGVASAELECQANNSLT
jgi:hypothetical protein